MKIFIHKRPSILSSVSWYVGWLSVPCEIPPNDTHLRLFKPRPRIYHSRHLTRVGNQKFRFNSVSPNPRCFPDGGMFSLTYQGCNHCRYNERRTANPVPRSTQRKRKKQESKARCESTSISGPVRGNPRSSQGRTNAATEPADLARNEIKEDDNDLSKKELTKRLTEIIGWTKTNSQTCLRAARLGDSVEDGRNGFKLSLH